MLPSPGGGGGGDTSSASAVGMGKPERPSSLGGPGKLTRRLLCYHSEHCMSHSSPPRPNNLAAAAATGKCYILSSVVWLFLMPLQIFELLFLLNQSSLSKHKIKFPV